MTERSIEVEFREFVIGCHHRLLRMAYALTGDHAGAEDLVQTALVRTHRYWRRVDTHEAYARKIIVNLHTSWWRRRKRSGELLTDRVPEPVFHESTLDSELDAALWAALISLAPRTRAVIVLRHMQDMSLAEVATTLGCSEGNVKALSARGLAKLRAALTPPPPSEDRSDDEPSSMVSRSAS